jgi:hypothetical protein
MSERLTRSGPGATSSHARVCEGVCAGTGLGVGVLLLPLIVIWDIFAGASTFDFVRYTRVILYIYAII